jgi:CubicO group peptidase (beta-lactamase class C family)
MDVPGYQVAVAYEGKIVFSKAYGYADLERKQNLNTKHLFRIASHSKTFTATALMQLVEQGKLCLDDYIVDYLPWLKDHKDKRFQKVTIRQLMSHGAGVIRDGIHGDYWQLMEPFPNTEQFKKDMLTTDLVIDTNLKLKYSNFGYSLLGLVIESITNKPYNSVVTDKIVKPLKLKNTGPEYRPEIAGRLVTGYSRTDINKSRLPIAKNIDTRAMSPNTGFYSSAEDLCHYFTAHMLGSKKLLNDESKKEMQRIHWQVENADEYGAYALGLEIEYAGNRRVLGHGGGFPGHSTKSYFDSKNKLVVVVLTNSIDGPASLLANGIFSTIDYYQDNSSKTRPKHDLTKFEGRFMNLFAVCDFVSTGEKIVDVSPNSWKPFDKCEELEFVDSSTLKVTDTNSFNYEGELIHFTFTKEGEPSLVMYSGETMWPETTFLKKQGQLKVIKLN